MGLVEITEGTTRFFVPEQDAGSSFPPGTGAVFYNRRMELNRDATILFLRHTEVTSYLDAMGASGARGLRVAHECGIPATINDYNPDAVDLIERNAAGIYEGEVSVTQADCRVLMAGRRFDAVDLDPFGTPAPFVDVAATSAKRYLFVTATDTAPLCGAHLKAGMRRYGARPLNTEYHSEVGLRILLGFVAREVVKYDRGIEPLFCFAREHFVRLHLRVTRGAGRADKTVARIGYIHQCPECPERLEEAGITAGCHVCPRCGKRMTAAGPLWLGPVNDRDLIHAMAGGLGETPLGTSGALGRLLTILGDELDTSTFYNYHRLAKCWHTSPRGMDEVLACLKDAGYEASRTHYDGRGIKTTAPLDVLRECI